MSSISTKKLSNFSGPLRPLCFSPRGNTKGEYIPLILILLFCLLLSLSLYLRIFLSLSLLLGPRSLLFASDRYFLKLLHECVCFLFDFFFYLPLLLLLLILLFLSLFLFPSSFLSSSPWYIWYTFVYRRMASQINPCFTAENKHDIIPPDEFFHTSSKRGNVHPRSFGCRGIRSLNNKMEVFLCPKTSRAA